MTGDTGEIYDLGEKKATIYFTEPIEKRIVQRVEWQMEDGWIYKIDYFNKYGIKYASEFLDIGKNVESKVYYLAKGQEMIILQPHYDVVTLQENGMATFFFQSYNQFLAHFMRNFENDREKILFVQEENQSSLLELKISGKNAWDFVLFLNKGLLETYRNNGGKNGYQFFAIPERYPDNYASGNILILTASDQIEKLEELVLELPNVIFHIAAHTLMSDKLHKLAECKKVKIYPVIHQEVLKDLWNTCDLYLDINHYREIDDAVDVACQMNLLIMGFENTLHQRELLVKECIFSSNEYKKMALLIERLINNSSSMQRLLEAQQRKRSIWWEKSLRLSE